MTKGRGKAPITTVRLNKVESARWTISQQEPTYSTIYFNEPPKEDTDILLSYSPSPFKGSHRATKMRVHLTLFSCKDPAIHHFACGPLHKTHDTIYYKMEPAK